MESSSCHGEYLMGTFIPGALVSSYYFNIGIIVGVMFSENNDSQSYTYIVLHSTETGVGELINVHTPRILVKHV